MNLTLWHYLLPPIVGGAIGFTSDTLAIRMLFRPYRPIFLFGRQLPLTPGLFPRGQARFAKKVAATLTDKLLTPEEVQLIARRLLTPEQLQQGIRWLLLYALGELTNTEQRSRLATSVGNILQNLLESSLPNWTTELSRSSTSEQTLNQLFDRLASSFRLNAGQAEAIANWLSDKLLTPELIRQALANGLSDKTVEELDRQARDKAQGGYWLLANVIGVKGPLLRLKEFCQEQPLQARAVFADILKNIKLRGRIIEVLTNLDLQSLPPETLNATKSQLVQIIQKALSDAIPEYSQRLAESIDWQKQAGGLLDKLTASDQVLTWIDPIAEESARVLGQYLSRELEQLVAKFLPVLGLEEIVIAKINETSAQELEEAIQGVAKQELQTLPYVGMILGATVGIAEMLLLSFLSRIAG